jgi:chemotaxis response regulator CheB
MPKEAIARGAAAEVLPLGRIAGAIVARKPGLYASV